MRMGRSIYKQRVIFEWLPGVCESCKCFGHTCSQFKDEVDVPTDVLPIHTETAVVLPTPCPCMCDAAKGGRRDKEGSTAGYELNQNKGEDIVEVVKPQSGEYTGETLNVSKGKGKPGSVEAHNDEYAEECLRLVAEAWASASGFEPDEQHKEGKGDVGVADDMIIPTATLIYRARDGTETHEIHRFQQKHTRGAIDMETKVTVTLDQIYGVFCDRTMGPESESEECFDDEGDEEEGDISKDESVGTVFP